MAIQSQQVTFTGAEPLDGDFPYIDVVIAAPYSDPDAYFALLGQAVDDGGGPVAVWIEDTSRAENGFRILAAEQFSGTVSVVTVDIPL